ncbi:MAG: peptidoglycan-binding domain-containing protein, partial [Candidatus Pacebacteria bacterium]|nr:peptidoglycan-binding domain-containing protein [Candidatus Paceibacterota bacterium]
MTPSGNSTITIVNNKGTSTIITTIGNNSSNSTSTQNNNSFIFTEDSEYNDNSQQVLNLQKFLNYNGYIVAKTGIGSIGKESVHFGLATMNALKLFQKVNGLKQSGKLDSNTRYVINSGNIITNYFTKTPITNRYIFNKILGLYSNNNEVRQLQKFLNSKGFYVTKYGASYIGKETTYFGIGTYTALKRYQKAKGLSQTGRLDTATIKYI